MTRTDLLRSLQAATDERDGWAAHMTALEAQQSSLAARWNAAEREYDEAAHRVERIKAEIARIRKGAA